MQILSKNLGFLNEFLALGGEREIFIVEVPNFSNM
jgi:hypothetical protein